MAIGVAVAFLLWPALRAAYLRARAPRLPPPAADSPDTTILLPVRDESANIAACLATLCNQQGEPAVLVVDDGSTDDTATQVRDLQAAEPRLRMVAAESLPPGWGGKVHALWTGAAHAPTPWLLLTDADTRHRQDLLARAHAGVRDWQLDALSLAGTQEAQGAEALVTAPVFAILDTLLGDWRRVAAGGGPAVANGQFVLLRRAALDEIGGFAALRAQSLDDVALARALRGAGFRIGFVRAGDGLRVRMYRGFGAAWAGWRRNLALILGPAPGTASLAIAILTVPVAMLGRALASGSWAAAGILWGAGVLASALFRHGQRQQTWWALAYPTEALVGAALLVVALLDHRRGRLAAWKGRAIRGA